MAVMECTPLSEIEKIHAELNHTFLAATLGTSGPQPKSTSPFPLFSIPYRAHQLRKIARLVQENADDICSAIYRDMGKPRLEVVLAEIGPIISRALKGAEEVEAWAKPEHVEASLPDWQAGWGARLEKKAKGVALIIAPWNYPLVLIFQPLCGAVAAGCPAAIKPSEIVPTFSALLAKLVPQYLDPAAYRVVQGGVPEMTKVLELKWDHIFYTGNGRIARIISAAAAKHLTPMTLELGGKSPVIVDPATCGDLEIVAKRIIWGKINNAGQICIVPDYVIMPKASIPAFVSATEKALLSFFPNGALSSPDYGRIVSPAHFARVKSLLERTTGEIVIGGAMGAGGKAVEDRGVEPTVVVVEEGDALMQEELFAPVLPILAVESVGEAVAFVRKGDHPLVIYAFTEDKAVQERIVQGTMSGSVIFNDTFQQVAVDELPFGGVGESGYGRQVLKHTFEEFVYYRSIVDIPQKEEAGFGARYPPSTPQAVAYFSQCLSLPITEPSLKDTSKTTTTPKVVEAGSGKGKVVLGDGVLPASASASASRENLKTGKEGWFSRMVSKRV